MPTWQTLAASDLVVAGECGGEIPVFAGRPVVIQLKITRPTIVSGSSFESEPRVEVVAATNTEVEYLQGLRGKEVLVFAGVYGRGSDTLRLPGSVGGSVFRFDDELAEAVRQLARENTRSYELARADKAHLCAVTPVTRQVDKRIAELGKGAEAAEKAVQGLIDLGWPAFRAIVCSLEAANGPYVGGTLRVRTSAGFEQYAFFKPEKIVDILDLVLSTLSGESFGSIASGGSEKERARAVKGWWTFLGRELVGARAGKP